MDMQSGYLQMGQKIEIAFCARLIYSETEITGERVLYPYDLHPKYAAEQTAVYKDISVHLHLLYHSGHYRGKYFLSLRCDGCPSVLSVEQSDLSVLSDGAFRRGAHYFKEQTGVPFSQYVNRFRVDRAKRLLAEPQSQVKLVAQQVGFENINTFIRVFKEPLNKSPTADDGSFPPILRFEKREIHTVFHRFSNLVLTKNLSPSTAADLIRTSLRALRAFRPAFTRKRF